METSSILFGLLLFTGSIAYVILPFRQTRQKTVTTSKGMTQQVGKREVVLAALRDLDFDFKTGKVSEEDYQPVRNQLMAEAAQYLEQEQKEAERLEALIQSRRKAQQEDTKCGHCDAPVRAGQRFCSKCGSAVNNESCPSCGKNIKADDLFCPSCGNGLQIRTQAVAQS
jgi:predicted nucleic acid-binding Zn ribbon protein